MKISRRWQPLLGVGTALLGSSLLACSTHHHLSKQAPPVAPGTNALLRAKVETIVVIYAENRAFDNMYGNFPGAHGLSEVIDAGGKPLSAYHPQVDRNGQVLSVLPPTWG